jgi:Right handed beta helix region
MTKPIQAALASVLLTTVGSALQPVPASAQTIYVDQNATGPAQDGSTWCTAYVYLQDALSAAASSGGSINEIRVADGTYKPDQGATHTAGDREATFQLLNGVTIAGGYAGCDAKDPNDRDIKNNETILSGDLSGNDLEVPVEEMRTEPTRAENSLHVVTGRGLDERAYIDGCTVCNGNAYIDATTSDLNGGGLLVSQGILTLRDCTFRRNSAHNSGGGLVCFNTSLTVVRCTFADNSAHDNTLSGGGGMFISVSDVSITSTMFVGNSSDGPFSRGGGICCFGPNIEISDSVFSANSAEEGGGIFNYNTSRFTRCLFSGNSADYGGGLYNIGNPIISSCTFSENRAYRGSGMYCRGTSRTSEPVLEDCTFVANTSYLWDGGAMFNFRKNFARLTNCKFIANSGGAMTNLVDGYHWSRPALSNCLFYRNIGFAIRNIRANPTLDNCTITSNTLGAMSSVGVSNSTIANSLIWGNLQFEIEAGQDSTISVTYSNVEGGHPGEGNIDADPLFVRPPNPGTDETWGTEDDDYGDLRLRSNSPSIDTGDPAFIPEPDATDIAGAARLLCDRIDMGAYEFAGDYDCNQTLDLRDIAGLQICFTGEDQGPYDPTCKTFDTNADQDIDQEDYARFLSVFSP